MRRFKMPIRRFQGTPLVEIVGVQTYPRYLLYLRNDCIPQEISKDEAKKLLQMMGQTL